MRALFVRLFGSWNGFFEYLTIMAACISGLVGLAWWQGIFLPALLLTVLSWPRWAALVAKAAKVDADWRELAVLAFRHGLEALSFATSLGATLCPMCSPSNAAATRCTARARTSSACWRAGVWALTARHEAGAAHAAVGTGSLEEGQHLGCSATSPCCLRGPIPLRVMRSCIDSSAIPACCEVV
jgi:hypothetical protein